MKKLITLAACLALSGCATILTPQRCAGIDAAAHTVQEIAALLVAQGAEPARAAKFAAAVKAGQMALQIACAQANPMIAQP